MKTEPCPYCQKQMDLGEFCCGAKDCSTALRTEILAEARPPLTVAEWLSCHLSRTRGLYSDSARRTALMADGVRLSIQASGRHYSTRADDSSRYTHVEVCGADVPEWCSYAEPDGCVYGWVPVDDVEAWCKAHGGIVGAVAREGATELLLRAAGVRDEEELLPREALALERLADWDVETVDALCFALTRVRHIALQRITDHVTKKRSREVPPELRGDAILAGATARDVLHAVMRGQVRRLRSSFSELLLVR